MERSFAWVMEHVGSLGRIEPEVQDMIRDEMPAYAWIIPDDYDTRYRTIICDRCGSRVEEKKKGGKWPSGLKQGWSDRCPTCGEPVTGKYVTRGHNITDKLYAIFYRKSAADPNVIVGLGVKCVRDYGYTDQPWTVDTDYEVCAVTVFVYGEGGYRWQKSVTDWGINGGCVPLTYDWVNVKAVGDIQFPHGISTIFMRNMPQRVMLVDTLTQAISDTPFERAWHDDYLAMDAGHDATAALTMIARYPQIEYMTKLGMTGFLHDRLRGNLPGGLINWRGRDMRGVLRLSKQRLGELRADKSIRITPELVMILQYVDGEGIRCATRTAVQLAGKAGSTHSVEILFKALELHQPTRRAKALKYLVAKTDRTTTFGDAQDYWRQCGQVNADLNDDAVAFPRDLPESHERLTKRIRLMRDAEKDKLIEKNLEKYQKTLGFEFGGLILRPAVSSAEVIREGEVLGHCVGGYVNAYAAGSTVICVLRRAVEPDAPWRTVEITPDGRLVQDRGYKNDTARGITITDSYRAMLDCFWAAWKERKTA